MALTTGPAVFSQAVASSAVGAAVGTAGAAVSTVAGAPRAAYNTATGVTQSAYNTAAGATQAVYQRVRARRTPGLPQWALLCIAEPCSLC